MSHSRAYPKNHTDYRSLSENTSYLYHTKTPKLQNINIPTHRRYLQYEPTWRQSMTRSPQRIPDQESRRHRRNHRARDRERRNSSSNRTDALSLRSGSHHPHWQELWDIYRSRIYRQSSHHTKLYRLTGDMSG